VVIAVALSLGLPALVLGIDLDRQLMISLAIPVVGLTVISLYASTLWSSVVWVSDGGTEVWTAESPLG